MWRCAIVLWVLWSGIDAAILSVCVMEMEQHTFQRARRDVLLHWGPQQAVHLQGERWRCMYSLLCP